jgi:hypothetical protein
VAVGTWPDRRHVRFEQASRKEKWPSIRFGQFGGCRSCVHLERHGTKLRSGTTCGALTAGRGDEAGRWECLGARRGAGAAQTVGEEQAVDGEGCGAGGRRG